VGLEVRRGYRAKFRPDKGVWLSTREGREDRAKTSKTRSESTRVDSIGADYVDGNERNGIASH